jgi:hypothetical protein
MASLALFKGTLSEAVTPIVFYGRKERKRGEER